jgi:intein/homing endonuclease
MKKITEVTVNKIISLKSKGLKIERIAQDLGISARSVQKHSINFPHPNRRSQKTIPESANRLSYEKAEILGYLASEGCEYETECKYVEFDPRRNNTYKRMKKSVIIEFSNKDTTIQKHFQDLMKKVFNYETNFDKKGSLKILRKQVIKNLNIYIIFGSHKWKVPSSILNSKDLMIKRMFCRAFCDGDGTLEMNKKEVRIDSVNGVGLSQLRSLLSDLDVNSKFYKFSSRFRLVINDVKGFKENVDFLHPDKNKRLNCIINKKGAEKGNFTTPETKR